MPSASELQSIGMPAAFAAAGHATDELESEIWRHLSPSQRERALKRLSAIELWANGSGEISVAEAAALAEVSLSRFYRLAADWKAKRKLESLGTFAGKITRRSKFDAAAINALQAVVSRVVALNVDASVSKLVDEMVHLADVSPEKLPGTTKLREIVEAERRRVDATHDAGTALTFDCVATSLPRDDGRPHILFACMDRGTRAVLGFALGDVEDSVAGHAAAARDALATIKAGALMLPWGLRMAKAEITAGADVTACGALARLVMEQVPGANVQISSSEKRFGRYFKSLIGPRIGSVGITPTRTLGGTAIAPNNDKTPWPKDAALDVIARSVTNHNNEALTVKLSGSDSPPGNMVHALEVIARGLT